VLSEDEQLSSLQATLYSLHKMQFVALCCIRFSACTNCGLLHYAVFPLQTAPIAVCCIMLYSLYGLHQLQLLNYDVFTLEPAPNAVCCIRLYSLYSLHQLQIVALLCIPFKACTNCGLLHYAVFPLQPAPTAVCSIMLYSLYSLHQLRFAAL